MVSMMLFFSVRLNSSFLTWLMFDNGRLYMNQMNILNGLPDGWYVDFRTRKHGAGTGYGYKVLHDVEMLNLIRV